MSFKIERKEAESFSRQWNKGGITILLSPEAIDFATDFANVAIRSFIALCQQDAAQQAAQAAERQKPKLILEGIR